MNRRGFIGAFLGSAPAVAVPSAAMTRRPATHGGAVGLLGFGMMRLPTIDGGSARNGGTIDQEATNALVDRAIAAGVNYFDTSPVYCSGQCERATGIALSRHPRSSWRVAAKLSNFNPKFWPLAESQKMYAESFRLLKTDLIDFYLLHSIGGGGMKNFRARFVDNGVLDWLVGERAAGRIANLGFSFHGDFAVWEWMMAHHAQYHWDFAQIQMNYVDWRHAKELNPRNTNAERLYGDLDKAGIPAVVMEPLLGGRLARFNANVARILSPLDPSASFAKWAFRFVGSKPRVMTVLTGISKREHLEEDIRIFSPLKPLDAYEERSVLAAGDALMEDRSVPCTSCAYCMPCPYGIDIPTMFEVYNLALAEKRVPDPDDVNDRAYASKRLRFLADYEAALAPLRRAEHCTGCGRCGMHCPQGIDIPREVRRIGALVERLEQQPG